MDREVPSVSSISILSHVICIQELADQEDKKDTAFFCISAYNEYWYSQIVHCSLWIVDSHKSSPIRYCLTQKVHALPDTADCKSVHLFKESE